MCPHNQRPCLEHFRPLTLALSLYLLNTKITPSTFIKSTKWLECGKPSWTHLPRKGKFCQGWGSHCVQLCSFISSSIVCRGTAIPNYVFFCTYMILSFKYFKVYRNGNIRWEFSNLRFQWHAVFLSFVCVNVILVVYLFSLLCDLILKKLTMIKLLILFPILSDLPKSLGYFHSLDDKIHISKTVQLYFLTPWALLYVTSLLFWEVMFNLFLLESDEPVTASANRAWCKGQCESWDWARSSSLACFHLVHHSAFHVKFRTPLGPCYGKALPVHLQPSNQFNQVSDILMKGPKMNLDWPCYYQDINPWYCKLSFL